MNETEGRKKEILPPLFVKAGAALLDCQGFEYGLGLLLLHFSRLGIPGLDETQLRAILDNRDKATAGQLVKQLRSRLMVDPDLEALLADALAARNFIVHRFLVENVERVCEPKSRAAVVAELEKLRATVRKADARLRPTILSLGKELDGFDGAAFEREALSSLFQNEIDRQNA